MFPCFYLIFFLHFLFKFFKNHATWTTCLCYVISEGRVNYTSGNMYSKGKYLKVLSCASEVCHINWTVSSLFGQDIYKNHNSTWGFFGDGVFSASSFTSVSIIRYINSVMYILDILLRYK